MTQEKPTILADLVTLTKPRIISLLLVTTVAPMFMTDRGLPSAALVFWVVIAGYLMAGGANAINMWFDRDIDDRMTRTRLRPIPAGRITPAPGAPLRRGPGRHRVRHLLVPGQSAERLARAGWAALLRIHLHHAAQAEDGTEHRHRRCGWRVPAARGLGRGDRAPGPRRHLPLRHHLLLDAAALLGARPHQAGRVRQGRGADDAGGEGRSANQVGDAHLYPAAAAAHHHAGGVRRAGPILPRGGGAPGRRGCSGIASRCCARRA